MSISAPYSLSVPRDSIKINVLTGTTSAIVAGNVKIFLGASVNVNLHQQYTGRLMSCMRRLLNDREPQLGTTDTIAYANYETSGSGSVTLATTVTGIGDNDVAVIVSGTFGGGSHYASVAFDVLISALQENSKDN